MNQCCSARHLSTDHAKRRTSIPVLVDTMLNDGEARSLKRLMGKAYRNDDAPVRAASHKPDL
jgi:hypothetical protein